MELARGARKQTGTSRRTHGGGRRPRRLLELLQEVRWSCVYSLRLQNISVKYVSVKQCVDDGGRAAPVGWVCL